MKAEDIVISMWYWNGSCRYLAEKFPRVFESEESDADGGNPYDGQQRLLDFMTNADASRKEKYKQMNLYDVLYSLDFMLERAEAEREAMKKR